MTGLKDTLVEKIDFLQTRAEFALISGESLNFLFNCTFVCVYPRSTGRERPGWLTWERWSVVLCLFTIQFNLKYTFKTHIHTSANSQ